MVENGYIVGRSVGRTTITVSYPGSNKYAAVAEKDNRIINVIVSETIANQTVVNKEGGSASAVTNSNSTVNPGNTNPVKTSNSTTVITPSGSKGTGNTTADEPDQEKIDKQQKNTKIIKAKAAKKSIALTWKN